MQPNKTNRIVVSDVLVKIDKLKSRYIYQKAISHQRRHRMMLYNVSRRGM